MNIPHAPKLAANIRAHIQDKLKTTLWKRLVGSAPSPNMPFDSFYHTEVKAVLAGAAPVSAKVFVQGTSAGKIDSYAYDNRHCHELSYVLSET